MKRSLPVLGFLAASGLLVAFAFPGGISGKSILAPVDIFSNFFFHFRYLDPQADGIPQNHYIIDQATYDLPLQYLIHKSIRQGILPWWDPYSYGGRPLLADAHINGTDPIRLLVYRLAPFLLAYNWNLVLKSVLTGLGMFLLLRFLGHPTGRSVLLGLCFQFAGCFALFFGHPWIQASFLYYPFLWVVWSRMLSDSKVQDRFLGPVLCALVFLCGNLQSHSYLPLFAAGFCLSALLNSAAQGWKAVRISAWSLGIGVLLAAPVLFAQVEFFWRSVRLISPRPWSFLELFHGPLSLAASFPWLLGTFRTVDLCKAFQAGGLGFVLFVGTVPFILALTTLVDAWRGGSRLNFAERWASFLLLGYFVILSTPLARFLATRISPLACLGLIVLAAAAFPRIQDWSVARRRRAFRLGGGLILAMLLAWGGVLGGYHQLEDTIREIFLAQVSTSPSSTVSPALRNFQLSSFFQEVGWANPEVLLSWLSLGAFWLSLRQRASGFHGRPLIVAVGLSAIALYLFYSRYTPCQPANLWDKLLAGGPQQQKIIQISSPSHGRVWEETPEFEKMILPGSTACLYGVHVVHGYSALQPKSVYSLLSTPIRFPLAWIADWKVHSDGTLERINPSTDPRNTVRFSWEGSGPRAVKILNETCQTIEFSLAPGPAGRLVRTDTYYPGWGQQLPFPHAVWHRLAPCFSVCQLAESHQESRFQLVYMPRFLPFSTALTLLGVILVIASCWLAHQGPPSEYTLFRKGKQ